jgi:hypothetical protein
VLVWAAAIFIAMLGVVFTGTLRGSTSGSPLRTRYLILPPLLVLLSYAAKRVLIFPWYAPLFAVPLLVAGYLTVRASRSRWASLLFALLALPFFINLLRTAAAAADSPAWYVDFASGARVRSYLALGKQLYEKYPSATLLSSEIGGLGYAFPGKIEDALGLASPRALAYHPLKVPEDRGSGVVGAIPLGFVKETQPDIIVSLDLFFPAANDPWVAEHYTSSRTSILLDTDLAIATRKDLWGNSGLLILLRKVDPNLYGKAPQ